MRQRRRQPNLIEALFGERIQKHGVDMVVRLDDGVAGDADRLQSAANQHFRIRVKTRAQRIGQYRGALQTTNVERTSVIAMTCNDVLPDRANVPGHVGGHLHRLHCRGPACHQPAN